LNNGIYVKIEDVLALIIDNDKLREQIAALPAIIITELEDDTK
jgi:hypothetical protein